MTKFRAYCIFAFLAFVVAVVFLLLHRPAKPVNVFPEGCDSVEYARSEQQPSSSHWQTNRRASNPVRKTFEKESCTSETEFSKPAQRKALLVDINSADTLTLQLLYGIGPAFASRIVRYRERLGGFVSTEQLLEVYGFTEERYKGILPNITVGNTAVRKIKINEVTLKQLIRHPYMEYYQARDLISLRDKGQRFHSAQDLLLAPTMDTVSLLRIVPYIDFSE